MVEKLFNRPLSRRDFLKLSGAGMAWVALSAMPKWALAAAEMAKDSPKTLVVLFQRGAADGLNIVVPFTDPIYRQARPTIGLNAPGNEKGVLDLDGKFGLHPALEGLMPMWNSGAFAIVEAVGCPDGTRSHFDGQDNMETGTPGVRDTADGWLNRSMERGFSGTKSSLAAVAISQRLPRILRGDFPVATFPNLNSYRFFGGETEASSFDAMYASTIDKLLSGAGKETEDSVGVLQKISKEGPQNPTEAGFPKGHLGPRLFELGKILKAGVGLRVAFLDIGGWDHHFNEGSADGLLGKSLKELGDSIAAFYRFLGDQSGDVLLATMTEFGRTLQENGNRGTDHGHASVMMLFGGGVQGGKIYGRWPGIETENLFEGRDLQVTTDFRQVHSEILTRHLGITDQSGIFPGFTPGQALGFLG